MERIASFCVDHTCLQRGMYISRVDDDVVTYDLRMCRPNVESVPETGAIHALEHLGATWLRNSSRKDEVIYFGPMGCRTGFYLLLRDSVGRREALELVRGCMAFCAAYEGEIPGATAVECGNFADMDLPAAKALAARYVADLASLTEQNMTY